MLSDTRAAYVATALSLCIKTKQNRRWVNNGANEERENPMKDLKVE
jgi:hypothetical protein